ncbi:hypothetical protein, partial [Thiolapillus sp.]|uniref:hypothetical protein n=1 Tax=Thiolapillus sp. TaxID=2017437 RepID=UPI003AF41E11
HNFGTTQALGPIYIPREPASIVCNSEQVDLLYSVRLHRNRCYSQLTQEKLGRGFGKMQANGPEGTDIVLI